MTASIGTHRDKRETATAEGRALSAWREQLLEALLRGMLVVGLFALVGGGIIPAIQLKRLDLLIVYVVAYAAIAMVTFVRRLGFALRAGVLLLLLYALGALDFSVAGLSGDGRIFLFTFVTVTAILFSLRHGIAVLALSLLTMAVAAWLLVSGRWSIPIEVQANSTSIVDWVSGSIVFLLLSAGVIISITFLIRSLATSVKTSQQAVQELQSQRENLEHLVRQRTQDLEYRSLQLQAAAEVARDATTARELDDLLNRAVNLIRDRFGFYHAGIFLVDELGEVAVLRAATGETGRLMIEQGLMLRVGEDSMVGDVTATGQPRIRHTEQGEESRQAGPGPAEIRSEMTLALRSGGRIIGALDVQSRQAAAFGEDDVAVLQTMADQLAVAIENVRLIHQMQQTVHELEIAYGRRTRESWQAVAHGPNPLRGYRYRRLGIEPVFEQPQQAPQTWSGGHSVVTSTPSEAVVPIKLRDQVIGVLEMRARGESIPAEAISTAEEVANRLALALENARLFEEARDHAEELAALNQLAQALTTRLSVEEVLEEVYKGASRLLDTRNFYVALYDAESDEVTFALDVIEVEGGGSELRRPHTSRRAGQGLTEYVIRTQRSLLIEENVVERLQEMGIEMIGRPALSWLGVPLMVGDRVLGVMAVQSYTTPRTYDEHDRDLMTAMASQAAIALQNAHLFEEAQRRATQLATAAEVARDATAILEVDQLLDQTVHLISKQFGFYHAGVFLLDEEGEYAVLRAASSEGGRRMLARGHRLQAGSGTPGAVSRGAEGAVSSGAVGIVGHVVATGEGRIASNVGSDAVFFNNPDLPDTRSEMALPLKVRGRVIGALDVQSAEEAAFTPDSVAVLQTLGDQLATAITNANLFQEVRADVQRRAFINEVLQAATSSLDAHELLTRAGEAISRQLEMPCMILECDAEDETLRSVAVHDGLGANRAPAESVTITAEMYPGVFKAIHTRQLETVLDVPTQVRGAAAGLVEELALVDAAHIPLIARDRVLGVLTLGRQQGHPALDQGELAFIGIIAANLSVSMENARLYQEAVRRARRERLAREITAKVVGSTDLDTILKTTARELGKAIGSSHALVRLGAGSGEHHG